MNVLSCVLKLQIFHLLCLNFDIYSSYMSIILKIRQRVEQRSG